MTRLSRLGAEIEGQPMFDILERVAQLEARGIEVAHYEIGEPDFDTPAAIVECCVNSIRSGDTHYAPSRGILALRQAIVETTARSRNLDIQDDNVLVSPGANALIYLALSCLIGSGDRVAIPDPGFPTYRTAVEACGASTRSYFLNYESNFDVDLDSFNDAIADDRVKVAIINSPSNPLGAIIGLDQLSKMHQMCREHSVFVISDEIYARLLFNDASFVSISRFDKELQNTLIINGFSKAFAMTGWRLGAGIGPADLIEKMGLLSSTIFSCVPPFIQRAGVEAIQGDQSAQRFMASEYADRVRLMVEGLNRIDGISCFMPEGAIYAFPCISGTGMTSDEFFEFALKKAHMAVCPGNFFGRKGEGFVRLSAVSSPGKIKESLEKLKEVLA